MGGLFKYGKLSSEIIEFLKYKVRNSLNDKYDIVSKVFRLMLEDGMTYYTGECYKNVIDCELRVFANMLEIVHLWEKDSFKFGEKVNYYIMKCQGMYGVNLIRLDLIGAKLRGADLSGANLSGANLIGANLREANLREADLSGAILMEATLIGALFDEKQIQNLKIL